MAEQLFKFPEIEESWIISTWSVVSVVSTLQFQHGDDFAGFPVVRGPADANPYYKRKSARLMIRNILSSFPQGAEMPATSAWTHRGGKKLQREPASA